MSASPGRPVRPGVAREAIVAAADRLFHERGVSGVALGEIARDAGVSRRTLYYHFASKDQLVVEHVRLRDRAIRDGMRTGSVLDAFRALDRLTCGGDYRGCAITNAAASSGARIPIVGRMTARHKREMEAWFVAESRDLGAATPEIAGRQLMLLFEGAVTAARVRRIPDLGALTLDAARRLLCSYGADVDER